MALNKYKMGDLITLSEMKNDKNKYGISDVKGISIQKKFIETKANMNGVSLKPYLVITPDTFCYVPITSRNGEKITLAYNDTKDTYIVSSSYIAFKVKRPDLVLSKYLFIYFCRPEFDRFSRFNSWGSAREAFQWEDMCDINIELPPLAVQQKFVDIYNAMIKNQKAYENGIEDLKLVCDAYIEELRRNMLCEKIGPYIKYIDIRNEKDEFKTARGVSSEGKFIDSRAKLNGVNLKKYKIVNKKQFAYNPSRINLGSIALSTERCIISPMYITFEVDENKLIPEYLMLWLNRKEFHRSTLFYATGSVRDVFDYQLMEEVEIPIPDKKTQKSIADVYLVYENRRSINKQLKSQISDICPILIKGSLEEGKNYEEGKKA